MEEKIITDQDIQQRFTQLPPDIQRAIDSSDAEKTIQNIGTQHQLHIDQMGGLKDATYMVMLGFADSSIFADNIAEMCNVPHETAQQIAEELGTQLFNPIRDSMQKFTEEQDERETITTTPKPVMSFTPMTPLDHMLSAATFSPQKTIELAPQKNADAPTTQASPQNQPQKTYSTDPYREPTT